MDDVMNMTVRDFLSHLKNDYEAFEDLCGEDDEYCTIPSKENYLKALELVEAVKESKQMLAESKRLQEKIGIVQGYCVSGSGKLGKGDLMEEKAIKNPTQCEMVLKYIRDFGSITTWQAMMDLGVARLASRIWDLKQDGYEFTKTRVNTKNRYGKPTHYDEYRLVGEPT